MTEGLDLGSWRSESMAFRLEIADFGAFYERTYDVAYRTALGIVRDPALAADVTQEAYVAAYRHRDRFRGDAPSAAWLHRIVVNQALAALRRRAQPPGGASTCAVHGAAMTRGATIARLALLEALDGLPPRQRAAVILRYYHDYDYAHDRADPQHHLDQRGRHAVSRPRPTQGALDPDRAPPPRTGG